MERIYDSTEEEQQEYQRLVAGLPETSIGLGPHSMEAVRAILFAVKPKRILEIGFDRGRSAALWLGLSDALVVSIDVSDDPKLHMAVAVLQKSYPGRMIFVQSNSKSVLLENFDFDLAFIDGDHSEEGAFADMELVKALKAPWVALDDWLPQFGPGVQAAAKRAGFVVTSIFKQNIALGHF